MVEKDNLKNKKSKNRKTSKRKSDNLSIISTSQNAIAQGNLVKYIYIY